MKTHKQREGIKYLSHLSHINYTTGWPDIIWSKFSVNESVPTSKWRSDRIRTCLWCCPECINVPGHGAVMAVGSAKWEAEADPACLPADTATQEGAHQSPPWNPISSNPQILFQFMGNLEERVRLNHWNATGKIPHMETHYINDCFLQYRNYKKKGKKEEIAVRSMD